MKAEILSIGTELLMGEITDTNASYLASRLPALGIDLYWVTQVGDNRGRLVEALRRGWGRSALILATGGLGPTEDDLTREAIAEMIGEEMRVDPTLERELREFFARRGISMPSRNIKQATLVSSAQAIPNPRGTAPGWWVERDGKIIVAMPGPPAEMQFMWERQILPRLQQRATGAILLSRTIKTFGLGEALVDEMVSSLLSSSNPTLGIYAKPDGIYLRLAAKTSTRQAAEELLAQGEAHLREILGGHIWGVDDETLETMVGKLLASRSLTLATMESCTGGLLATTLTAAPESSVYYRGGMVATSKEIMIAFGVEAQLFDRYGGVSPEVAEGLAKAARQCFKADIGVGNVGVVGPEEIEGKPAGTIYTVVSDGTKKRLLQGNYPPQPQEVKRRATVAALFGIRQLLLSPD